MKTMTGAALCHAASLHPAYVEYAEKTYGQLSRTALLEHAAAALKRDRFSGGGGLVLPTVDDRLLASALLELAKE